ncbi:Hypothetical protein D9617_36g063310 [Elsinoe fawcettii]|nr:Hypothetical protein D9617_36g063310 [Elsinoe fawcettii]
MSSSDDVETSGAQPAPQPPAMQTGQRIPNVSTDIATTLGGETYKIGYKNRVIGQILYLWEIDPAEISKKKKEAANKGGGPSKMDSFDPTNDGAARGGNHNAPLRDELIEAARAMPHLEIGRARGIDVPPAPKGKKGRPSNATTASIAAKPVLPRPDDMMRVCVPITPGIAEQAKYVVACRPSGGRCQTRVIDAEKIAFFPELWDQVKHIPKKERRAAIGRLCRTTAAIDKTRNERPRTFTVKNLREWASSNSHGITPADNLASTIALQWWLYQKTENVAYIKIIKDTIASANPDLRYGPRTVSSGVDKYFSTKGRFDEAAATQVIQELKRAHPEMGPLDKALICKVRSVMLKQKRQSDLPYAGLGFFLEICETSVPDDQPIDKLSVDELTSLVDSALASTAIHCRHKSTWSIRSTINAKVREEQEDEGVEDDDNIKVPITALAANLESIRDQIRAGGELVAEEHGAVTTKFSSIAALMKQISETLDIYSAGGLYEQLGSAHAVCSMSVNLMAADRLDDALELLMAMNNELE